MGQRASGLFKSNHRWCDIGSGPGTLLQFTTNFPADLRIICLDLAFAPLRLASLHKSSLPVNGDLETLPFRKSSFDGVVISSMLQWVADPAAALGNAAKVLKKNGIVVFSLFTEGSFRELYSLRASRGLSVPAWFPKANEFLVLLKDAGLEIENPVEEFSLSVYHENGFKALKSLSAIGGTAVQGPLLKRKELLKLCRDYDDQYSSEKGTPVTYCWITGTAKRIA